MANTYYAENRVLDKLFSATNFTPPSTWYIGLATTVPTQEGVASGEISTVGTGYARVAVPNTALYWGWTGVDGSTNGVTRNLQEIAFPQCSTNWGTIAYILFFDASSGGNLWYWQALTATILAETGNKISFLGGSVLINNNN